MSSRYVGIGCMALMLLGALSASAQIQLGGLMRDELALGLTPTIKSAGMGGAYVGVDGPQSMNPASLSSMEGMQASLYGGFYDLGKGPSAYRGRADLILPAPIIGGYSRLMVDGLASDGKGNTNLGTMEFDSVTLGSQYGRNITDWWAVGFGGYPYESAEVDLYTPDGKTKGEAFSKLGSIQLGTLFRPCEYFNIGAQFIYIKDNLEATIPNGTEMGWNYYIHYFAVGASVKPMEGTLLALDYWNGEIRGRNNYDTPIGRIANISRFNFGIQQKVCNYCDLRLGSSNNGLTTGFTLHINNKMDVDYAYINKALYDKQFAFGNSNFHGLSVTYRF